MFSTERLLKWLKRSLLVVFGIITILLIVYRDLVGYGIGQAKGQLRVIRDAIPTKKILDDPSFSDSLKSKILLIEEIKDYASGIGLVETENYTSFFDQKSRPILWNISACEPYAFKPKEWSFPFLGKFAYKGFFDLEKAKIEEKGLREQGLDTNIRTVSAWSTLGWFRDPILSNMLNKSEGDLAETILHELTHGTIFIRDSLEFNENLASFIGEMAAIDFLKEKYGQDSPQLTTYLRENKDAEAFRSHVLRGREKLDSLYSAFENESDEYKETVKKQMIEKIINTVDTVGFFEPGYREILRRRNVNNAYLMSYKRYHSYHLQLNDIFDEHDRDIAAFIDYFRENSNY